MSDRPRDPRRDTEMRPPSLPSEETREATKPLSSSDVPHEPERYELEAPPAYVFHADRREFVKLLGGGLLVLSVAAKATPQESGRRGGAEQTPTGIDAWLRIADDGRVTVFTGKTEIGQNIRTSLTQAVADELRVKPDVITMVMADTDLTPVDAGTFGSRTTPMMARQLRNAAATARVALIELAAARLQSDAKELTAADGRITNKRTGASVTFGALTRGQALVRTAGDNPPITPRDQWQIAGTSLPKVNARAMVTGRHEFTPDLSPPGMLHGKVLRPSALNATLTSLDTKASEGVPGVTVVRDGSFAGAVAPTARDAARAIAAMRADWTIPKQSSAADLFDRLAAATPAGSAAGGDRGSRFSLGRTDEGVAAAAHVLSHRYTVAYIAHVPLEPRAAVAEWTDGKLTVWVGTQRPFGVRTELAEAFRIPAERIRVIVPDTGSAYGGKHTGEVAVEAARLAKSAGKPVKLVWTREEEFTWAYFRPAGVIDVKSGVTRDGKLVLWEFDNYNSGGSAIRTLYDVPHQRIEFHPVSSPLRQGSYRGLAATANHFARETHMDELAHLVSLDPLEFRLANLTDARLRGVLVAAAEKFNWRARKATRDVGVGIAGGSEKGSYVATCAEVSIERPSGRVKVDRIVVAFECGAVVNPDGLKNQVEGSIVQGLGGALFEAIDFADGRILNASLEQYRVPRFSDMPVIETVLVDRKDLASAGAGETPIVAVAPAIGNAIFAATGVRLRAMPLIPGGVAALSTSQPASDKR